MSNDNLSAGGPKWRPLVTDLETLLRAIARDSPKAEKLKANFVKRLAEIDAQRQKMVAGSLKRWQAGEPKRQAFNSAAKSCAAKGLKLTPKNILMEWPDDDPEPPGFSTIKELHTWWMIYADPDDTPDD